MARLLNLTQVSFQISVSWWPHLVGSAGKIFEIGLSTLLQMTVIKCFLGKKNLLTLSKIYMFLH